MPSSTGDFPEHYTDEQTILGNGIRVVTRAVDPTYYHPDRSRVAVILTAGSRHAASGQKHAVEHNVANLGHNENFSRFSHEHHYIYLSNGAATYPDRTTYAQYEGLFCGTHFSIEDLADGLRLQTRVLREPDFSAENVELERERILQEHRGQSPAVIRYWQFVNARTSNVLPDGNLGSREHLASMTRQDLIETYERLYVGSNLIVPVLFPAGNEEKIDHSEIARIVESELGHLPRGRPVDRLSAPHLAGIDLRLDGRYMAEPGNGRVEIAFTGVPQFTSNAPAQKAFLTIFSRELESNVLRANHTYYFGTSLDDEQLTPGVVIALEHSAEKIRSVVDVVGSTLRSFATRDLSDQVDWYRKSQAKAYRGNYRFNEGASEAMNSGLAMAGKPQHAEYSYVGAATVTADQVTQYARSIIHGPIAVRADVGPDGDPQGRFIPFAAELAAQFRAGVPQPESAAEPGSLRDLQRTRPGPLTRRFT